MVLPFLNSISAKGALRRPSTAFPRPPRPRGGLKPAVKVNMTPAERGIQIAANRAKMAQLVAGTGGGAGTEALRSRSTSRARLNLREGRAAAGESPGPSGGIEKRRQYYMRTAKLAVLLGRSKEDLLLDLPMKATLQLCLDGSQLHIQQVGPS